jgi:hypothetical protein
LFLPVTIRVTSWRKARRTFQDEGEKLIELTESLSVDELRKRVPIKRPFGIARSSCDWSARNVLEHLIDVGSRIAIIVVELSHGERPNHDECLASSELESRSGRQVVTDYRNFLDDFSHMLMAEIGNRRSRLVHAHPTYGKLTLHGWACVAAVHQRAHRRQMERIVTALRKPS